ncbi:MAG: thiamine pyrophosphate-dependent enzyme [Bacteroidota bacterium]|nr:thiamine pyrophosphate-dependent enzyme [Bacteroidota bacterium]
MNRTKTTINTGFSSALFAIDRQEILNDYKLAFISRHLSLTGRREVLNGRAKFGIFGDGKEVAQIAYAKCFKNGDWRSGYYRDQTFMLASGLLTPEEFFAQLYGNTDPKLNPSTAGRNFNNHFATVNFLPDGGRVNLVNNRNSSSDISSTAGQMPRLLGLAYASKLFRNLEYLWPYSHLSNFGNEVAFGSIGDASTSEGLFFETINAACVLQVPMAIAVWDDGFGISVPIELQTTKSSISKALKGFEKEDGTNGCLIYQAKGWDYPGLVATFQEGIDRCRAEHVPVLFHVDEITQPLGHSTSGSHERYKSAERLQWEKEFDPILKMREWIIGQELADTHTLDGLEAEAVKEVKEARQKAWNIYVKPYIDEKNELLQLLRGFATEYLLAVEKLPNYAEFINNDYPSRKDILSFARKVSYMPDGRQYWPQQYKTLISWIGDYQQKCNAIYSTKLYAENYQDLSKRQVNPVYNETVVSVPGREILNRNFEALFQKYPMLVTFGEDTGKLGDVDQGMRGMQQKYGDLRVTDTGIREPTIIGQGIGLALRGFRPIAEIQYLDYLAYALPTLTDDLASLHYRTNGRQVAPLIVRTRGHRLIGIWHSGSPLGMMLNSLRGMNICVPRNMTQASGMYNTLLELNDPAIVIESLKGYDRNEPLPENPGEYKVPLGLPEIITEGTDVTLVTYGWCVEIAAEAVARLGDVGISVELIDVQTLLPFDVNHIIKKSVMKTSRVLFLDEDVPGGGTAYMMQKVVEEQDVYHHLDALPQTLSAREHRPAYDTDGDYFSKPNGDTVFEAVYNIMREANPLKFL